MSRRPRPWRSDLGGRSRGAGRRGEWIAALLLMAKGYRILGFRLPSRAGEIDILASRGPRLVVVEVKRRQTLEAALQALTVEQRQRLLAAGQAVQRSRPQWRNLDLALDMVALAPGRFPRHLRNLPQV